MDDCIPGRNPRSCPAWLAEALDSCFIPVPVGRQFPEIKGKAEYLARLRSWNFTSLEFCVDEMLLCCWWIFVDLGLVTDCSGNATCEDVSTGEDTNICKFSGTCKEAGTCGDVTTTCTTSTFCTNSTMNPEGLKRFLLAVSVNYSPDNPYHNLHHVVDVLQCCYHWLHELIPELLSLLSRDWVMAVALACLCHDLGHGSFGNAFLCRTGHPLAMMFGAKGVLEHQHSLLLCALLRQPALDPLWGFNPVRKQAIRERIVEFVMATDMSTHFEFIGRFQKHLLTSPSEEDCLLTGVALVKCSDISNVCRPFPVARRWGHALLSEFLHQGDYERLLGLPLGPLNDRSQLQVAEGQRQFLLKVAGPLYEAVAERFPGIAPILLQMRQNYQEWAEVNDDDNEVKEGERVHK